MNNIIDSFLNGDEHKYFIDTLMDLKNSQSNPTKIDEDLRTLARILKRSMNINVSIDVLDTLNDEDFFGVNVYPNSGVIRNMIDMALTPSDEPIVDRNTKLEVAVDHNEKMQYIRDAWKGITDWHMDIDAKMLWSLSARFTPEDIFLIMLFRIESTIHCFFKIDSLYRAIKVVLIKSDFRVSHIMKSSIARSVYAIPMLQVCGFVNYRSELPEESAIRAIPELYEKYLNMLTKMTTYYGNRYINRNPVELKQELVYTMTWIFSALNDIKHNLYKLKKDLKDQYTAEKSIFVKKYIEQLLTKFTASNLDDTITSDTFLSVHTPKMAELKEAVGIDILYKQMNVIKESAESKMLDKLGKCKQVTQEEIDVLRLEIQKIESVDDKIYYMEKTHDYINIIDYSLSLIGDRETKGRVRESQAKLLDKKSQLLDIRERIVNMKIHESRFNLFVKYPSGYEG